MQACDNCGGEAHRQQCNGDGRYHHHGMVHTMLFGSINQLAALCNECWVKDSNAWALIRKEV